MRNKFKFLPVALILSLAVGSFGLAQAQDQDTDTESETQRNIRTTQQGQPEDQAARQADVRRQNILRLMDNQINRLERAFGRLSAILTRIEAHRDTMAEQELDVTEIDDQIADAKLQQADIAEMLVALNDQKTDLENAETGPELRTAARAFMASVKAVQTELRAFHRNLRGIVTTMKNVIKAARLEEQEAEAEAEEEEDEDEENSDSNEEETE